MPVPENETPPLMLDTEVVSNWDNLTSYQQEHLTALHDAAKNRDPSIPETDTAATRCNLQPSTGRVIVIGLLDPIVNSGTILYEGPRSTEYSEGITWDRGDEAYMLRRMWQILYGRRVVTFNGFNFDGPFLAGRSLRLGIPQTLRLATKWYERAGGVDLREELSVFGRVKAYNLAWTCDEFGVPSPKTTMDGSQVEAYYRAGRIHEIAEYCLEDLEALAGLWRLIAPALTRWVK